MVWEFWRNRKRVWNNRKLAFVAILIATSVAFIFITTRVLPIAALPTFKLAAGGLPIKVTGYIFGPLIGALTGIIADLISFALTPTFIHWYYLLAFMLTGLVPGIVGYFMNRRWRLYSKVNRDREQKISNSNFFTCLGVLVLLVLISALIVGHPAIISDEVFASQELITNRWVLLGIMSAGNITMFIAIIFMRFFMKPKKINIILPIITFSAILETLLTPLTTLGDQAIWELKKDFLVLYVSHLLLSPIQIWVNLIVISVAYQVIAPLIYNKSSNGWHIE